MPRKWSLTTILAVLPLLFVVAVIIYPLNGQALSNSDFNPGRIIDDGVFFNSGTMSVSQIQSFLNSQVPTCDTNHAGYTGTSGTTYNAPWVCLKDFYENPSAPYSLSFTYKDTDGSVKSGSRTYYRNNAYTYTSLTAVYPKTDGTYAANGDYTKGYVLKASITSLGGAKPSGAISAAQIIYNAAQQYGINPQVILVTLQKEQSLIADTWPAPWQYQSAMGYGCPDYQPCSSNYAGFSKQVLSAAWQFRQYTANPDHYNFAGATTRYIQYNPSASCGGSNVYIQNQATANLYNYTPYQPNSSILTGSGNSCSAYGNLNFWKYFNKWFGSTQFAQPAGGLLYRQSSNGKIFLYANEKLFFISSPSIMQNYGFDNYKTVPASDTVISSMTSGGTLTNIVQDDAGILYMVNNGYKHQIPSPAMCTTWAISCADTNIVHNLGSILMGSYLKSGAILGNTAYYNGVYYRMSDGVRLPYADKSSFTKAGLSTSSAINLNSSNVTQPLGKLQISTPGVIKFPPKNTIYYFNGTEYYTAPSMAVYDSLALNKIPSINAPLSSYNSTDNVISNKILGYWIQLSNGEKYIVNNGQKLKLSAAQQNLWPSAAYIIGLDNLANLLPAAQLGSFIKSGINFYQLMPDLGEKRYISSIADYTGLGVSPSNTTRLNSALSNTIKNGPFAFPNGRLIKVEGDTAIYVVDSGKIMRVASMSILNAYNFDTSMMRTYSQSNVDEYEKLGQLQSSILPDGSAVIPYGKSLIKLSAAQMTSFGAMNSKFMTVSSGLTSRASIVPSTQFFRNSDNGGIYYGSGGALHYVSSTAKFYQLGGKSTPLTTVNTATINLFTIGSPA